jgi:hypothetical protein
VSLPPNTAEWFTRVRPSYAAPLAQFTIMIRGANDPERRRRGVESGDVAPHRTIAKASPEVFENAICKLMSDGAVRTFNAISVDVLDKPADVTAGTRFEDAIWNCALRGELEFTAHAPILFRRREAA